MDRCARSGQAGFTYLALMIVIVVMGIVLAALGEGWHAAAQREKEAELLFAGNQMRAALILFYLHAPAQTARHPASLADLLLDPRTPAIRRYLRRIYADPVTGNTDWGLIRGAGGEIYGVYSRSDDKPVKQGNFARADRQFEGAKHYSDWVFMFTPGQF